MSDIQLYGLLVRDPLPEQAVYNRIFAGGIGAGESFNWKPFLPVRERQYRIPFCVSFSRTNCAEAKAKKEGIDINLSDRELGVISGTGRQGNYMDTVSDFFRKKGITLEKDVPFTDAMLHLSTSTAWTDIFNLPDTTGKKRYKGGNFSWVYGLGAMIDALNHSPLQIAVGIGSNWESNGPIGPPAKIAAYHAVTLYHIDSQGNKHIQDSIGKEWKILKPEYPLTGTLSFRDLPENWKDNMAQIEFVHRAGTEEYGFLEKTAHSELYHKAIGEVHLAVLAEVFGVSILGPDNKIDFSKARDITL